MPSSNQIGQTTPGSGRDRPTAAHNHGALEPKSTAASPSVTDAATDVRIQKAVISALLNPIASEGSELVEGTGVLLPVSVDVRDQAERLILLHKHVIFEHQTVHVRGHEASIGI